jgi:hypothetical protein
MNVRLSPLARGALIVAAIVLMPGRSWAVYYPLGPSKDDWGLKYDVEVKDAGGDALTVVFRLSDQGRLKPIYSITVVAFSKPQSDGGRTYLVKAPIELKSTKDHKLAGQVRIPKEYAEVALCRILTLNVDGRPQTAGAAYYDLPLKKFLESAHKADSPQTPTSIAAPPATNAAK